MLRIAEHWHGSDLGRQRQGNEDNYFVRAPLFVVADGMGGAQAGEVASEMAVELVRARAARRRRRAEAPRRASSRTPTGASTSARAPTSQRAGMGTTVTAAYVGENEVTVAHVGDSRCYLLRDGELVRLTRDHSLVGELVRARQADRGAGRGAPAALRDHPRARARAERPGRRRGLPGAAPATCSSSARTASPRWCPRRRSSGCC